MQSIIGAYKVIRDDVNESTLQECALHYLTRRCQADTAHEAGVGNTLTRWVESHFDSVEGDIYLSVPYYQPCRVDVREYDTPYTDILVALNEWYTEGVAPVLSTAVTGGSPLWSDSTNDLFRALHDSHHWKYQLGDDVASEVKLGFKTATAVLNWCLDQRHSSLLADRAAYAIFFEVAGQAAAATWLGGYDGKRQNPHTGELLAFSQKVILTPWYEHH